ncbi:hypothetical protein KI811_15505 [Geobacter hydrogenophilus]|nr:hypothetical protein [Geobacter hydrogenophilus]MBT0895216.1 hypothetical protein [Geobacter hydrogenophilus]
MHEELCRRGYESSIGLTVKHNVLVIQKRLDDEAITLARKVAWRYDKVLVFDIDDFFDAPLYVRNVKRLAHLADIVTTATPEQAEFLYKTVSRCGGIEGKTVVIENPIDYGLKVPISRDHSSSEFLRVVWFGFSENIPYDILNAISLWKGIKLTVITDKIPDIQQRLNVQCNLVAWEYDSFIQNITNNDVALLSHHGSVITNAKSANKMSTAIMCGLPVIASNTPDYFRLASKCGVKEYLFESIEEVQHLLVLLKHPEIRNEYLSKAQHAITDQYSITELCDTFLAKIQEVSEAKNSRPLYYSTVGLCGLVNSLLRR